MSRHVCPWLAFIIFLIPWVSFSGELSTPGLDKGLKLFKQGQYEKAVAVLKKEFKAHPDNWLIPDALGDAYLRLHKLPEALEAYNQSLALRPDNPSLEYYVANEHNPPPAPLSPVTQTVETDKSAISIGIGLAFLLADDNRLGSWQRTLQVNGSMETRLSPDSGLVTQLDLLLCDGAGNVDNTYYSNSNNTWVNVSPATAGSLLSGNCGLMYRFYPLPSRNPLSFFVEAGPGLFLRRIPPLITTYTNLPPPNTSETPEVDEIAPSFQGGVGFLLAGYEGVRIMADFRVNEAWTLDPVTYGSVNLGAYCPL